MLVRCPHCGKTQLLSPAELSACGHTVICPQCVSEFTVSEVEEVEQEVADPTPRPATQGISFCPHCGQHLPASGLRFCPYCGRSLALADAAEPVEVPRPAPVEMPKPAPAVAAPADPVVAARLADMPFIAPMGKRHHVSDVEASPRFKAVAYVVIVALAMAGMALIYLINK